MTDTITRLRELRADWRAKSQVCKDELRAVVAQGPSASRASLDVYRGNMSEALEYYQAYLFQHADALLDIADAARECRSPIDGPDSLESRYIVETRNDLLDKALDKLNAKETT